MFEDMLLILIALGSASAVVVATSANIIGLAVLCALAFTSAVFWMGVRSGRSK